MKKVHNPFPSEKNPCFGCSQANKHGLNLEFYVDGDELVSFWEPQPQYQGFINILHGGIQATIMDEIASWTIYVKAETAGVTSEMKVKYHKPIFMNKGKITIRSKIIKQEKRFITLETKMIDIEGKLCSEAEVKYFTYPYEIARKKLFYPGIEKFLPQS